MTAHTDAVEALKPCPRCQGAGELRLSGDREIERVRCKVCGHDGKLEYNAADAVASWNAGLSRIRAAVADSAEMREAAIEAAARAMCNRVNGRGDYDDNPERHPGWNAQAAVALDAILALITSDRERIRAEAFEEAARAAEAERDYRGERRLEALAAKRRTEARDHETMQIACVHAARAIRSLASKERGDG